MIKNGDVIGRWTVVSEKYIRKNQPVVDAICSCGKEKTVRCSSLLSGQSKSCGCLAKESIKERMSTKGGRSKHPLFQRWYDLNRRCYDPKRKDYEHYGGRGITVCPDWHKDNPQGFQNFLKDMESTYQSKLEIDRVDNDGDYCKENCKWSTRSEQVINSRDLGCKIGRPHLLNDGEDITHLAAMAAKYGLNPSLLQDRIGKLGMSLEEALTLPVKTKRYFLIFEGVEYSIADVFKRPPNFIALATRLGISSEDLTYYVFGNNVRVEGVVNKQRVIFDKKDISLSGFTFKLPRVYEQFVKYYSNTYDHKEYRHE